jgi:hypothetical protein
MSHVTIRRLTQQVPATLSTAASTATTLSLEGFSGVVVDFGTLSTSATSIQIFGASSEDSPFRQLRKPDGSAVSLTLVPSTSVGGIYALPDEVFGVSFLKLVAGQAAAEGVVGVVTLKS